MSVAVDHQKLRDSKEVLVEERRRCNLDIVAKEHPTPPHPTPQTTDITHDRQQQTCT